MNEPKELLIAKKTLDEHKAEDIEVLDVEGISPFCSYYVLATCPNIRAVGALQDILEDAFEKEGVELTLKEGEPESGWIIVQAGDVVVHLFLSANRKEVDLASLIERIKTKYTA